MKILILVSIIALFYGVWLLVKIGRVVTLLDESSENFTTWNTILKLFVSRIKTDTGYQIMISPDGENWTVHSKELDRPVEDSAAPGLASSKP